MKIIELFAGIGTQYQGFKENIKTEVVGISEIDQRALKIYEKLHGKVNNFGDISKIEKLPYADIWTYSFPCTDLSIAGKKEGLQGKDSSLIYEVLRLLKVSEKPKVLIMENVSNLVNKTFIEGFEEWIEILNQEGYITTWEKIKGYEYGGGTIRDRVFAVSVFKDEPFIFPKKTGTQKTVKDYLEEYDSNFLVSKDQTFLNDERISYTKSIKLFDYGRGGQGNRVYSIQGQGVTLTAKGGGNGGTSGLYLRPEGICKLSPIEMAKLMGWNKEQAIQMLEVASNREVSFVLGNAIELNVMRAIAKSIVQQYF